MAANVADIGLAKALAGRADSDRPVTIGLIGAGEMGTDIVSQVAHMRGLRVGAIADIDVAAPKRAIAIAEGDDARARVVGKTEDLSVALESNAIAVTDDAALVTAADGIDVVIDATGVPAVGAEIGLRAMEHGKHLVMMNVEADVCIGAYLKAEAARIGVTYTLGAGDEPSSCMELIEFVSAMGYPIVCAGKGKNNPLNIDATPDGYTAEAQRRNMSPRMLVEFVDGSKTMVEMAAIANATGLVPDRQGMHGPAASKEELATTLVPVADGGVLAGTGRVDFSIGKGVAPGVFVIAEMRHPRIRERMTDLKMGAGPYFTFIRPYHLTSLEVPLTCARVALFGKADMQPLDIPVAEVCAVAKRDLVPGETLDQIGEYCYRAWIMRADEGRAAGAVPCGLLAGAKVAAPIAKGALLTHANVTVDPNAKIVQLRARQDALLGLAPAA